MRTALKSSLILMLLIVISVVVKGQVLVDGFGNYSLTTNNVGTPRSFTIGDAAVVPFEALLNIRGDLLPGANQTQETLWGKVPTGFSQFWRMYRNTTQIGALHHGFMNNQFNIQAMQANGNMWVRNSIGDGIKVNWNGLAAQTLNGYSLNRQAYVALGSDNAIAAVLSPNAPWTRQHIVHNNQGPSTDLPYGAYRLWQENGITFTGNSKWAYLGQKFAADSADVANRGDFIAGWFDDVLPTGSTHAVDNFSFRFFSNLNTASVTQSAAGSFVG